MITLQALFKNCDVRILKKDLPFFVTGLVCDSKQVKEGDLFVAVRGASQNGASFIPEAIARGARIIVSEEDFFSDGKIIQIKIDDSRRVLAMLADRFYGEPSRKLKVIGITGTNGKTTCSYLLEALFSEAQKKVGVIGTISYRVGERVIPAPNTTPGPLEVQSLLSQMVKEKIGYAVMEVSSHALDQKRVETIRFDSALFTNLTQDHLDYHKTQEAYFLAKRRLFESLDPQATAVLNGDSPFVERIASVTQARVLRYALHHADIRAESLELTSRGTTFDAVTPQGKIGVRSGLIGVHNVYNILGVIGAALAQGLSLSVIEEGIARFEGVPGRLEKIEAGQPFHVFVDFAHTEDALRQVLLSLRPLTRGRLLLLFGCGGNRDRSKRPKMAQAASELSDFVVVTSDNPRKEDPQAILKEIEAGFPPAFQRYQLEEDRGKAIETILAEAKEGDTVLIAGKGHEAYQIFRDRTVPFDDRQVVDEILHHSRIAHSYGRALTSRGD